MTSARPSPQGLDPRSGPVPDVSVVVAAYNCSEYLPAALGSCKAQDFEGTIEAVVIDDGSTDDSERVLAGLAEELRSPRFSLVVHWQPNAGPAVARNEGIRRSRAPRVLFLDADDAYAPEAVRRCAEALDAHRDAALVYSDTVRCDEALQPVYVKRKIGHDLRELLRVFYVGQIRAFHRRVLEDLGGFDSRFEPAEDYDLVLRAAFNPRNGGMVHIPEPLYYYRANPRSIRAGHRRHWTNARLAVQSALERLGIDVRVEEPVRCPDGVARFIHPQHVWSKLEAMAVLPGAPPGAGDPAP